MSSMEAMYEDNPSFFDKTITDFLEEKNESPSDMAFLPDGQTLAITLKSSKWYTRYFTEMFMGCAYLICSNTSKNYELDHELRIFIAGLFDFSAIVVTATDSAQINFYKRKGYKLLDDRINVRTGKHIFMFLFEVQTP